MIPVEKWEKYFAGEMSSEEKYILEKQTHENKADKDAYELFHFIENPASFKDVDIENYQESINRINDNISKMVFQNRKAIKRDLWQKTGLAIAASFILVVGGYYFYQKAGIIEQSNFNVSNIPKTVVGTSPNKNQRVIAEGVPITNSNGQSSTSTQDTISVSFIRGQYLAGAGAANPNVVPLKTIKELSNLSNTFEVMITHKDLKELYLTLDNPICLVLVPTNKWVKLGSNIKTANFSIVSGEDKTEHFKLVSGKKTVINIKK